MIARGTMGWLARRSRRAARLAAALLIIASLPCAPRLSLPAAGEASLRMPETRFEAIVETRQPATLSAGSRRLAGGPLAGSTGEPALPPPTIVAGHQVGSAPAGPSLPHPPPDTLRQLPDATGPPPV